MSRPYLYHYASALARSQELSQAIARKELDKRLANVTGDKGHPGSPDGDRNERQE